MHRALAMAVVLALTAGPVGRVVCGWSCAQVHEVAVSQSCHEQSGAESAFRVAADHCEGSGQPVALTAKLGDAPSAPSPGLSSVQPVATPQVNTWTSSPTGDSAAAPPTNRLIPLRI